MKGIIKIPDIVYSNYEGFCALISGFRQYLGHALGEMALDFRGNKWFDANLLPVVYAYVMHGQSMDFTIVNLGTTIEENVREFLLEQGLEMPSFHVSWAVEPEHSTKRTHSGGIGLSLMRDFIHFNHGKYQIVSGKEYWEMNDQMPCERPLPGVFPGTIVNIEINQKDKSYYQYGTMDDGPVF